MFHQTYGNVGHFEGKKELANFNQKFTNAPKTFNGKMLCFEETFRSPFSQSTAEDATVALRRIREIHDESHGWLELEGYVEQDPSSKLWRAVRHHAQYK